MPDEREAGPTLRALGLCAKAGRLVCGTALICEALRGRNRPLLAFWIFSKPPTAWASISTVALVLPVPKRL